MMKIDRRAALGLFAMGTTPTLLTAHADGDLYLNRRIGLTLRKPAGWHFLSLADHWVQSRDHRDSMTAEARHALDQPEAVPILAIGKFKGEETKDFNPSIIVYDEPADDDDESALALLDKAAIGFKLFAFNVEVVNEPQHTALAGCRNAAKHAWTFHYPSGKGFSLIEVTTILALRGLRVQTFHFFRPVTSSRKVTADLQQSQNSISYTEA